jgi:hypothetical protein
MDAPQSGVEREAREFAEENESIVEEGGLQAVQRVFVQGAEITQAWSREAVEAANYAASVTRDLAAAIRDHSTVPEGFTSLKWSAHAPWRYTSAKTVSSNSSQTLWTVWMRHVGRGQTKNSREGLV